MVASQKINPAQVANLAVMMASRCENLDSSGQMIDWNLATRANRYRNDRIGEYCQLALEFILKSNEIVENHYENTVE